MLRLALLLAVAATCDGPPRYVVPPEFHCSPPEVLFTPEPGFERCEWTWKCESGRRYHWEPKSLSPQCLATVYR